MADFMSQGIAWEHPASILILDDDETFVRSLSAALTPNAVAPFTLPGAALRHLHALAGQFAPERTAREGVYAEDLSADALIDRRAALPAALIQSPERFAQIKVAIVDQVMPALPGTAFCRQVRELGVKTILLSGRMNDAEALAAFNNGDIDRYVAKNDPDALAKIQHMTRELSRLRGREDTASLSALLDAANRDLVTRHDLWEVLGLAARVFPFCEHYFDPVPPGFLLVSETGDYRLLLIGDSAEQRRMASLIEDLEGRTCEYEGLLQGRMIAWNILDAARPDARGEIELSKFIFQANRQGSLVWRLLAPDVIPVDYVKPGGSWRAYIANGRVRSLDS